ncbi:hypothetical protein KGQ25_03135 [Patescibacteria group bacterium]|nr:hypothetical protein [Patescibacteria group bacterium]MDE2021543.1 hypothetical protein [Patescibacteria group bacterium]MDE2173641.1 hypothetical protein [Patescibacteria group bacterium]
MKSFEKPREVRKAQLEDNRAALSRMGKKGAENAARNRVLRKEIQKERLREIAIEKAREETISPDGDVLPPDLNFLKDNE